MDSSELQKLSIRTRGAREAGITLIIASGILALFLFIPRTHEAQSAAPVAVATSTPPDAFANVPLQAKSAIVYDLATGKTLYEKNPNAQLPLASLTKLLTVYAAFSELSPNTPIVISQNVMGLDAPHAFSPGETFTLLNLARLTLTASLNDGASAIAEATANRQNETTRGMLAGAAASLNLSQTYAVNGSGLDESTTISGGYGSAFDLARLAGALVAKAPEAVQATTQNYTQASSEEGVAFSVHNTDPMVNTIPRLLLSKTGYTDLAGGNLALVFDASINHPIAIVVLGSSQKERFTDGVALVDATLAYFAGVSSL